MGSILTGLTIFDGGNVHFLCRQKALPTASPTPALSACHRPSSEDPPSTIKTIFTSIKLRAPRLSAIVDTSRCIH